MSKIKLRIPKKTATETVSVGNFHAKFKPGGSITVENRGFADYLIREHGLTEDEPAAPENNKESDGGTK
ncbi:MAG: hypothetical protein KIS76_03840 [Pyrinomonadaceae bacterium]|nr:hypothetical protein [Pyrinomonadaceae bacterium]